MVKTLELKPTYLNFYPDEEELTIGSINGLADGIGISLTLEPHVKGISHYLYRYNNGAWRKSEDERIELRFPDIHVPKPQHLTLEIKGVLKDGTETKTYKVTVGYYPSELYRKRGLTFPSWIIIQKSDLFLSRGEVKDWILDRPTAEEKSFAAKTWGNVISEAKTDFEAAKRLAKKIIEDLEPHRGIPSDEMRKLSPFEQYKRVISGKDRVWCGNIAAIFSYASNALGIPCRKIGMNHPLSLNSKLAYRALIAEGHTTTEIFSRHMNHWVWIDPTLRVLGAYIGNVGPLSMIQFYMFLNDPGLKNEVRLIEYDPHAKVEKLTSLSESRVTDALLNYFKKDQIFRFYKADNR